MSKIDFTDAEKEHVPELKSDRIFKSATPKYTLDWYIKWIASIFILLYVHERYRWIPIL